MGTRARRAMMALIEAVRRNCCAVPLRRGDVMPTHGVKFVSAVDGASEREVSDALRENLGELVRLAPREHVVMVPRKYLEQLLSALPVSPLGFRVGVDDLERQGLGMLDAWCDQHACERAKLDAGSREASKA